MADQSRYELGRLSVAILESKVKSIIGDEAIKILKRPLEEAELKESLATVLIESERRFESECDDKDLVRAILRLTFSDYQALSGALRKFYERPSDPSLAGLIKEKLKKTGISAERIEKGISTYLHILHEELTSTSDETRQKIVAIAILGISRSIQEMAKSEQLYKQFSRAPLLSQYIRVKEFQTLVNERTKNFVGRDFIFKAIDNLVNGSKFSSGYIVIKGEPGIGKTSLAAQLIKTKGYLHHFNVSPQNIRSVRDFLSNLCAQLIVNYELDYPLLPENYAKNSGFLLNLLSEAVEKDVNHRVTVVIDALDEADDSELTPRDNRLYLPANLPDGVFFVVTTQEKAEDRLLVDHREDIYLRDDDPANLVDVRKYIENYVSQYQEDMSKHISQWAIKEAEFIDLITEKSEGNFMYLVHVLRDIKDGKLSSRNIHNVRNLPQGLKEYYQRHWRIMRDLDRERFERFQKPIICILATARQPVTLAMVAEWTKLNFVDVKDVVAEWRPFLNEDRNEKEQELYRIYHTSFQNFLEDEVGLKPYHTMVVDTALSKIKWPR